MRGQKTISGLIGAALLALVGVTGLTGCVAAVTPSGYAYVRVPPPPPQYEVVGVAPGYGYVWIRGHHAWRGSYYVWVPGRWALRPHQYARWHAGVWRHNSRGYYWVEGHWS